jgi:hypothetical protein
MLAAEAGISHRILVIQISSRKSLAALVLQCMSLEVAPSRRAGLPHHRKRLYQLGKINRARRRRDIVFGRQPEVCITPV